MTAKPTLAPYWHSEATVSRLMQQVLWALVPLLLVSLAVHGPGVLLNLLLALGFCTGFEALTLRARGRAAKPALADFSAMVTAALLALALPPLLPWWVMAVACLFAIVFAKHIYGGLGYNVFNPAMVGYVVVLVAFPQYLAIWPAPDSAWNDIPLNVTIGYLLAGTAGLEGADAWSGPTTLDNVKIQLQQMRTMDEIRAMSEFTRNNWLWLNLAALAGGLWLLRQRLIPWHASAGMLGSLGVLYFLFYAWSPATNPSPLLGLFSGGTMLAAFFIVTDPVSGATSPRGRVLFGAGVGILCFAMRKWGAYPDGIAFAILIMNMAAPLIDRYTLPRVYGYRNRP